MGCIKYDCSVCNYRDRTINFCGFCTRKILCEVREMRRKNACKRYNTSAKNQSPV